MQAIDAGIEYRHGVPSRAGDAGVPYPAVSDDAYSCILGLGEQGALRRASTAINVIQWTATKMVADLKQITGMALYERRLRGLLATPYWREVLASATKIMAGFDRLLVSLDRH